jgi:parvulin-like peptidyl-prolyl isomerase
MDEAIKSIVTKVGSKEQLDKILKQNNVSTGDFKKDLKEQVKIKKLAKTLSSGEVSDSEAKTYYNQNISKFKYPEQVRASHILVKVSPEEIATGLKQKNSKISDEEIGAKINEEIKVKEAKANELYSKLKADPSQFAKLAKENSEDTMSAANGGDLGFFAKRDMVPEFANAAFGARPNSVVGPVKTMYGYHIIIVTDRRAAGQEPFEKVKNDLKEYISNQKQLEQIDKLVESLKKQAKIEYVNKEYDPEEIQKAVQKNIQESGEMAKRAMEKASSTAIEVADASFDAQDIQRLIEETSDMIDRLR